MPTDQPTTPKQKLRWYQYRLRTLLILMTLLAVWMAWISHRARQQKMATEKILAWGGTINYDYQIQQIPFNPGYGFDTKALPPGPSWLRKFVGDDYFQNIVQVTLSKTPIADNDLEILENLPALKDLVLDETKITGKGLSHLESLKNLEHLFLVKTPIDDSGLAYLKNFTTLRMLAIDDLNITNDSLKHLKNFKKLELLYLINTRVTKKGAASIEKDLPKTKIVCGTEYIY